MFLFQVDIFWFSSLLHNSKWNIFVLWSKLEICEGPLGFSGSTYQLFSPISDIL